MLLLGSHWSPRRLLLHRPTKYMILVLALHDVRIFYNIIMYFVEMLSLLLNHLMKFFVLRGVAFLAKVLIRHSQKGFRICCRLRYSSRQGSVTNSVYSHCSWTVIHLFNSNVSIHLWKYFRDGPFVYLACQSFSKFGSSHYLCIINFMYWPVHCFCVGVLHIQLTCLSWSVIYLVL